VKTWACGTPSSSTRARSSSTSSSGSTTAERHDRLFRFPVFNQAITDNSKLVVREGQAAVFVSEGKLSEVFGPGTYTLDTRK
jgi:membrane protease subunit (stomatin/prohibitin family)